MEVTDFINTGIALGLGVILLGLLGGFCIAISIALEVMHYDWGLGNWSRTASDYFAVIATACCIVTGVAGFIALVSFTLTLAAMLLMT